MLQKFPLTQISQSDTLNYRMHQLQMKVDSLNKIVNETRIATGFFSDVISQDLYIFSTIIVIAGLVSWAFVGGVLALHKKTVEENLKKLHDDEIKSINSKMDSFELYHLRTTIDVKRSMYFVNIQHNSYNKAFVWATNVLKNHILYHKKSNEPLLGNFQIFINNAENCLNKCVIGDKTLIKNSGVIEKRMKFIIENSDEKFKIQLLKVDRSYKRLIYSDTPPPT